MGSIVGFFITNFPPAKLFLGDVGSQLLGWISAVSVIYLSSYFEGSIQKVFLVSLLSLPFYDVFFVAMRRFQNCRKSFIYKISSIVYPDKNHIHHLLLNYGFSTKEALLLLLLFYLLCSILCIISFFVDRLYLITFILIFILNLFFRKYFENKTNNMDSIA